MEKRYYINNGWEFTEHWSDSFLRQEPREDGGNLLSGVPDGAAAGQTEAGSDTWQQVRLPHTCKMTPYNYFDEGIYQMVCGYRRILRIPEAWKKDRVYLVIGAAGHSAEVFLNGKKAGEHHCGYTSFRTELTDFLQPGDNLLAVRVDTREQQNIPPFGHVIDYMTYGGLYREAYLEMSGSVRMGDLFVSPRVPEKLPLLHSGMSQEECRDALSHIQFRGQIRTEFTPDGREPAGDHLRICQKVFSCGGEGTDDVLLAEKDLSLAECQPVQRNYAEGSRNALSFRTEVDGARLWDALSPTLFRVVTRLYRKDGNKEEELLDEQTERVGFRRSVFREDGYYLNGRRLQLIGLNRHQSWPYVGYAMPGSQQERDAEILKNELGVNAVRTSHYPQSPYFYRRCDELGLLVFTEIPGWQHIGDEEWKKQAVRNTEEMVLQYRNHPSVILWGVRINESLDDDALYTRTNEVAHSLDSTRQTGGVRYIKKSHLLEDVYTYNDFSHDGRTPGCEKKKRVTPDRRKPYLISECNGHMFPTKIFDCEERRTEHMLRHARVLDAAAGEGDIAGTFGWCMFDYNTHRDFGSGDRICYHGVMDMYRNPKPAAALYAAQQESFPVLEVTSSMDIGEHPTGNPGCVYLVTNADEVRMYRGGVFVKSFFPEDSSWKHLSHGPILIDDYIGDSIKQENFAPEQEKTVKTILNYVALHGLLHLPPRILALGAELAVRYHMKFETAYELYGRYIGNWGGEASGYRFEGFWEGRKLKTLVKAPVQSVHLHAEPDHLLLHEGSCYDVASVRIEMRDQNDNRLPFYMGPVSARTEGPVEIVGSSELTLRGGCGGVYIRTAGKTGQASLILRNEQAGETECRFTVEPDSKAEI